MAQTQNLGIYQLPNGNWGYRFTRTVDGKRVNRKGSKDEAGKPFTTERAALQAKAIAEMRFEAEQNQRDAAARHTPQSANRTACGAII